MYLEYRESRHPFTMDQGISITDTTERPLLAAISTETLMPFLNFSRGGHFVRLHALVRVHSHDSIFQWLLAR